ncbi:hypothetical protein BH11PSE11_BH11PSE11_15720 [soil metagenome]
MMAFAISILIAVGTLIGIAGLFVAEESWTQAGLTMMLAGLAVLFCWAGFKRPDVVLDATAGLDDEPLPPPPDAFTMEQELKRKDRGEQHREK